MPVPIVIVAVPYLAEAIATLGVAIIAASPAGQKALSQGADAMGKAFDQMAQAASNAVNDGIDKIKKAVGGVSKDVPQSQSCSTQSCGGGDDGDDGDDKKKKDGKKEGESEKLNEAQQKNLKRFEEKLPKDAKPTQIEHLPDGGKVFRAEVPARNIPGSKAVYEKVVDAAGNTVKYTKTTFAPDGSIVHIKPKFP